MALKEDQKLDEDILWKLISLAVIQKKGSFQRQTIQVLKRS